MCSIGAVSRPERHGLGLVLLFLWFTGAGFGHTNTTRPLELDRFLTDSNAPGASIPPAFSARCTSAAPGMVTLVAHISIPCGMVPHGPKYPELPSTSKIGLRASAISDAYAPASGSDNRCLTSIFKPRRDAGIASRIFFASDEDKCRHAIAFCASFASAKAFDDADSATSTAATAFPDLVVALSAFVSASSARLSAFSDFPSADCAFASREIIICPDSASFRRPYQYPAISHKTAMAKNHMPIESNRCFLSSCLQLWASASAITSRAKNTRPASSRSLWTCLTESSESQFGSIARTIIFIFAPPVIVGCTTTECAMNLTKDQWEDQRQNKRDGMSPVSATNDEPEC